MADIFFKFFVRKNALLAWKNHVKRLQLAVSLQYERYCCKIEIFTQRQKAEAMTMRHRKGTFYTTDGATIKFFQSSYCQCILLLDSSKE